MNMYNREERLSGSLPVLENLPSVALPEVFSIFCHVKVLFRSFLFYQGSKYRGFCAL